MSNPDYIPYDFRQAGASDDSANSFRTWIAKASQAFADHWLAMANNEATLEVGAIRTLSLDAAAEQMPVTNLCCTFSVPTKEAISIWHLTQHDAQMLVADLIGMSNTAEIDERPPTEIERALIKEFFEVLARSIGQGWLGQQPIACEVEALSTNPKRVRLCRGKDFVVASSLVVKLPRGDATVHWISKKQEIAELLEQVTERRDTVTSVNDPQAVVEMLPIEIVGLLGQVSVPMGRLANLAVGDIMKLNQQIDRPITALVDGRPFFECWPGKVGDSVGLEISSWLGPAKPGAS